jgi:hypothetical protein
MRVLVLTALLLMSSAKIVEADTLSDFEAARVAYEDQRYDDAATRLEALVAETATDAVGAAILLESRKYLAASYLFLGREADAEIQFVLLLRQEPSYEIDPVRFPRAVLLAFDNARRQVDRERRDEAARQEQARREAEEARRRRDEEWRRQQLLNSSETIVVRNSRGLALLPFGIGQFQNGRPRLGLFFALSEALVGVAAVSSYLVHFGQTYVSAENRGERYELREHRTNIVNWVSVATFGTIVLVGVIEAQVRFVPERRTTQPRATPPPEARVGIGLGRVDLRIDF